MSDWEVPEARIGEDVAEVIRAADSLHVTTFEQLLSEADHEALKAFMRATR